MRTLRRDVLRCGLALGAGLAGVSTAPPVRASRDQGVRRVALENLHTGETFSGAYWQRGEYLPDALTAVSHLLRDVRTGEVGGVDPRLLDLLVAMTGRIPARAPWQVLSGFRSAGPTTTQAGEAPEPRSESLHGQGRALDLRLPGLALSDLRALATSFAAGGVGYYRAGNFVHVDVGEVASWSKL